MAETATMISTITELEQENRKLRKLLWIRHGCYTSVLYGDDGEMQCNSCVLDFKRMSAKEIEACFQQMAVLRYISLNANIKKKE